MGGVVMSFEFCPSSAKLCACMLGILDSQVHLQSLTGMEGLCECSKVTAQFSHALLVLPSGDPRLYRSSSSFHPLQAKLA